MEPAARLAHVMRERLKEAKPGDVDPEMLASMTEEAKPFQEFGDYGKELPLVNGEPNADETQPAKVETEAKPAETTDAATPDPLLTDEPYKLADTITPKDLAGALEKNPALKAALDADPTMKSKMFANARRSEKLAQMEQYVRSPEEAKVLQETTGTFNNLSDLMGSIDPNDHATVDSFLGALVSQTFIRGEDGQPIINEKTGRPMTDGSMFRMLQGAYAVRHSNLRTMYEKQGNDEAVAAIDLLNGLQGIGAKPASSESGQDIPPQLKAREDAVTARENSLKEQQNKVREDGVKAFKRSVALRRADKFDGELDTLMQSATGLGDFNRDAVRGKIMTELKTFLRTDHAYNRELKQLEAQPQTEATANKLVEVAVRAMRNNLGRLARPIFTEAGAQAMTQQATDTANGDARAKASRGDGGVTATVGPTASTKLEGRALNEHIVKEFVAANGRQPSNEEIIGAAARYRLQAKNR